MSYVRASTANGLGFRPWNSLGMMPVRRAARSAGMSGLTEIYDAWVSTPTWEKFVFPVSVADAIWQGTIAPTAPGSTTQDVVTNATTGQLTANQKANLIAQAQAAVAAAGGTPQDVANVAKEINQVAGPTSLSLPVIVGGAVLGLVLLRVLL